MVLGFCFFCLLGRATWGYLLTMSVIWAIIAIFLRLRNGRPSLRYWDFVPVYHRFAQYCLPGREETWIHSRCCLPGRATWGYLLTMSVDWTTIAIFLILRNGLPSLRSVLPFRQGGMFGNSILETWNLTSESWNLTQNPDTCVSTLKCILHYRG